MAWIKEQTRRFIQIQPMPPHDRYDLIYLFLVGGLLGTVYEVLQFLLIHGLLENRGGSILTPFNYVYGLGIIAIFLVIYRLKKPMTVFAVGTLLGGVVKYGLSVLQEYVLGSRSWDYSARPLNINRRTTLPYMLVWCVLSYPIMRFVFPVLLQLIHKIPEKVRKKLAVVLLIWLMVDLAVTLLAVLRYSQRANGIFFDNSLMTWIDQVFNDFYMGLHFPNMTLK